MQASSSRYLRGQIACALLGVRELSQVECLASEEEFDVYAVANAKDNARADSVAWLHK